MIGLWLGFSRAHAESKKYIQNKDVFGKVSYSNHIEMPYENDIVMVHKDSCCWKMNIILSNNWKLEVDTKWFSHAKKHEYIKANIE